MNQAPDLLVFSAFVVRDRGTPLRRFLDASPLPPDCVARHLAARTFESDEEMEDQFVTHRDGWLRRLARTAWFVIRHLDLARRARVIYCGDGACFQMLMALARTPLFDPRGKVIRRYAFHDSSVERMLPLLRRADPAFQVEMITREQVERASLLLGAGRVVLRPWKIDLEWYAPDAKAASPSPPLVCPGNALRHDQLIPPLLDLLPDRRIIRASRTHRDVRHERCERIVNSGHAEYLRLIQGASAILLPILPCDEPAGLTAAMEAIATCTPVIANCSMGIAELFVECEYPVPLVDDLEPASWARAIASVAAMRETPEFVARLHRCRDLLARSHAILPEGGDWAEVLRDAQKPRAAADAAHRNAIAQGDKLEAAA